MVNVLNHGAIYIELLSIIDQTDWSLHESTGPESIFYIIFEATYNGISTMWFTTWISDKDLQVSSVIYLRKLPVHSNKYIVFSTYLKNILCTRLNDEISSTDVKLSSRQILLH